MTLYDGVVAGSNTAEPVHDTVRHVVRDSNMRLRQCSFTGTMLITLDRSTAITVGSQQIRYTQCSGQLPQVHSDRAEWKTR
jgi:hypothetical protein